MDKKIVFTKVLAITGTALVWFPILVTIIISIAGSIMDRVFQFDYLMPAEFFPVALGGGGLLWWGALRAHLRKGLIGWGLGAMVAFLAGGQTLAVISEMASGRTATVGLVWKLVITSVILYSLALIAIGVGGILLWRDLVRRSWRSG